MKRTKKVLSLLLGLVMCLGMFGGALAEENGTVTTALLAGREIRYEAQASWYDSGIVTDEDTNAAIAALFEALSIQGSMAMDMENESMYCTFAMLVSGSEMLTYEEIVQDGTAYMVSPVLGDNIALRPEDVGLYMQKMGAYFDSLNLEGEVPTNYEETFAMMMPDMEQFMMQTEREPVEEVDPEAALMEMYAAMGLDGALEAAVEWAAQKMEEGEAYEADTESVYGTKATHGTVYTLNKDDLIEYFEVLRPHLETNETFFSWFLSIANASTMYSMTTEEGAVTTAEDETIALEEIMAVVPEAYDDLLASLEEIPEDATFSIVECYDDNDEIALYQLVFYMPEDEESEEMTIYMECEPEGLPLYFEMINGTEAITLSVVTNANDDTQDNGITATFSVIDQGEITAEILLQTTSVESETEEGRVWDGALKIAVVQDGQEMGVNFAIHQVDTDDDQDIIRDIGITASLLMAGMEIPVCGITANVYTTEPAGMPFEVDDSFVEVAHLDDEAFAEHMTAVSASSLQMVFKLIGELPTEVFTVLVDQMGMQTHTIELTN